MQKYTHIKKNWFCTTNNCSLIEIKDNKKNSERAAIFGMRPKMVWECSWKKIRTEINKTFEKDQSEQ